MIINVIVIVELCRLWLSAAASRLTPHAGALSPSEQAVISSANTVADADDKSAPSAITAAQTAAAAAAASAAASAHKQLAVITTFSPSATKTLSPAEAAVVKSANAVADASSSSEASAISAAIAAASSARKPHLAAAAAPLQAWQQVKL